MKHPRCLLPKPCSRPLGHWAPSAPPPAPPTPRPARPSLAQGCWRWGQMTHPSQSAGNASVLPPPRSRPRRSRSPSPQLPPSPAADPAPVQDSGGTGAPHPSSMTLGAGGCPGLHRGGPPGSHGPLPHCSGTPPAPGQGALCRVEGGHASFHPVPGGPPLDLCSGQSLLLSSPRLRPHLLQAAFPECLRPGAVPALCSPSALTFPSQNQPPGIVVASLQSGVLPCPPSGSGHLCSRLYPSAWQVPGTPRCPATTREVNRSD